MATLSVIVITKNEAKSIGTCLKSVRWADEIIVVDSGSTDGTVAICREYTDKIFVTDWPGFGAQKNRALDLAIGQWVLSLDADEYITTELQDEIQTAINDPEEKVAFKMPRLSNYCGRFMRHSGWWPDYIIRLFLRERGRFSDDLVHERLVVNGPTGTFSNPIIHKAFENLEEVIQTMNSYSTAGARMMHKKKRRAGLLTALSHGCWSFVHTYIVRAGFLDGREGFMLAVSNAEGTYYRYLKLMFMEEEK
jgi:glycosyltransferase involved in cell wall biosynthesis